MERANLEGSLRALGSTKATERKNGATQLLQLLKSETENVIKLLNHNSQPSSQSSQIGWNVVFKVVKSYMDSEVLAIQTAKESLSATTLTNRQKKKHEVMNLLKLVVKSATSRTPYLKLHLLLDAIITGLTDQFLLEDFGQDYTSLLHKCVLKIRKYWLMISPEKWSELLHLHCELYLTEAFDRMLLASTIQELIEGSIKQGKPDTNRILKFFQRVLTVISEMQPSPQVESLLTALNMFCHSIAAHSRHRLCVFGHNCMKSLLTLWDRAGTDRVKMREELIKQLHLQLIVHHPNGLEASQDGSSAYDWAVWKGHLASLQDSIVSHIVAMATRKIFLPGHRSKPAVLTDSLVALARDVFKQLPWLIPTSLDSTSCRETSDDNASAKRLRLCPSSMTLLDLIKEHSNRYQAVPWLQILTSLLVSYPSSFDKESLSHILSVLVSVLTDCTQGQLFKYVFDALTALTGVFLYYGKSLMEKTLKEWQLLWTACLSNTNSSHAKTEGYQENGFLLMSAILQSKLLHPGKEIWNIFLPEYCRPTLASASLLVSLLKSESLSENYFPNILGGLTKDTKPFPLRRLLLKWLLSETELENFSVKHDLSPDQMAILCLSLLHKDPAAMLEKDEINKLFATHKFNLSKVDEVTAVDIVTSYSNFVEENFTLKDLESQYINRDFVKEEVMADKEKVVKKIRTGSPALEHTNPLVCDMMSTIVDLLKSCVVSVCERADLQSESLPMVAWLASFLSFVVHSLGREVQQTQDICSLAKKCIEMCTQLFTTAAKQSDVSKSKLAQFIQSLVEMMNIDVCINSHSYWLAEFTRSCLSTEFVNLVFDLANGKILTRNNSRETTVRRNRYGNGFDRQRNSSHSRDSDFDRSLNHQSSGDWLSDTDVEMTDNGNDTEADSSPVGSLYNVSNFLQPACLKESECIRFLCVKLLTQMMKFDKRKASVAVGVLADLDSDDVRKRVLEMISQDNFHFNTALDVLKLLIISRDFLSDHYFVTSSDIKQILQAYRITAKELNKDWKVCQVLLRHLCLIIPHLGGHNDQANTTDSLLSCRRAFFKFVTDFGILCSDGSREDVKMEYVSILLELMKYDPIGSWGKLEMEEEGGGEEDTEEEVKEELAASVFVRFLKDDSVKVGMTVVEGLKWFFISWSHTGLFKAKRKEQQLQEFETITSLFNEILNIQHVTDANSKDKMVRVGKKDTWSNRLDVCLLGAMTILHHSSLCEKECLLWICRAVTAWDIPVKNIATMLEIACRWKSYPDAKSYLTCHLPFLLHHWFNRYKATVQDFPFKLLGYRTLEEFVKCHQIIVISSWFVATCQMDAVKSLLTSLDCNVHEAFLASLPQILVCLLPCLVETQNNDDNGGTEGNHSKDYKKALKCYDLLKTELSDNEINDCVCQHLSEITVLTLGCLHMDQNTDNVPVPDPNPPFYSQRAVQATLDHLANTFPLIPASDSKPSSLVAVLARVPRGLHSVLLSIATIMSNECCAWERLRYMHMYGLFVGMVMEELPRGLEGGWAAILRDIICRLVSILHKLSDNFDTSDKEITLTCVNILESVCNTAIISCPDEFSNYLHRVVDSVATTALLGEPLMKQCLNLMERLIEMSKHQDADMQNAWKSVGLLPDISCFKDINNWLRSHRQLEGKPLILRLQDLMDVCSSVDVHKQGLVQEIDVLASHITQNPKEVENLKKTPEGRTTLRKTCFLMLQLIVSPCSQLVYAASRCLGAIGPVDLHTLSYPSECVNTPYGKAMEVYRNGAMEKYCWLFHFLDSCLLDESLEVVKVAGDILIQLMSSPTVTRFQDDYGRRMKDVSFLFHYLQPFQGKHKEKSMAPPMARVKLETMEVISDLDLWSPCEPVKGHNAWIRELTCSLLSTAVVDDKLSKIGPMCQIKTSMCEESFPYLVHDVLQADDTGMCRKVLSEGFRHFFHQHCQSLHVSLKEPMPVCLRKESIRVMLTVVQYLRKQQRKQQSSKHKVTEMNAWDNNFWLDLNYLEVAKAAEYCQAHFSAFLFTEIWWDMSSAADSQSSTSSSEGESSIHPLSLASPEEERGLSVQSLLMSVSRGIGDLDLLYGCGAGRRPEANSRVLTYLQEQEQAKALTSLDIEARHSGSSHTPLVLLQAIQRCGADHLLLKCLDGLDVDRDTVESTNPDLEEFRYQTAWRLGQWDLNSPSSKAIAEGFPFHQAVYCALSSLRENHLDVARLAIQSARKTNISSFDPKVECSQNLYPFLSQLQCLSVLDELVSHLHNGEEQIPQFMLSVFDEGNSNTSLLAHMKDFSCEQNILELLVSCASVLQLRQVGMAKQLEVGALWKLVVCAREARRFQDAEKAMRVLKTHIGDLEFRQSEDSIQFEEARLYWARSEVKIALNLLKTLVRKLEGSRERQNDPLLLEALATYGCWLDETRSESPSVIMKDYLEKSVSLIDSPSQSSPPFQKAVECFVSLARFADLQYQQISDYMASPVYKEKKDLLKRTQLELQECREYKRSKQIFLANFHPWFTPFYITLTLALQTILIEFCKYLRLMEKNAAIDKVELESLEHDHAQFLEQALINYLRCLRDGNVHDVKVFRVVALWFENATQKDVNDLIQLSCQSIATYKFLPLYYQLAARMDTSQDHGSEFQSVLIQLMERVARQHPHHTLWVVMALAHANMDEYIIKAQTASSSKRQRGKMASEREEVVEEGRVQAAKEMLDRLKQEGLSSSMSMGTENLGDVVKKMEALSLAYIQLANKDVSDQKNERRPIPLDSSLKICKIRNLSGILIPSVDLKVELDGDYSQTPYPVSYGSSFKLAGGVNLPKIITCRGSDGVERTQLVKGNDDLRQDAVMQQVFALVNQLLSADPATKMRDLNIRTYKVVPLTQKCGLLEWCEGTQPMGQYLVGNIQKAHDGAHAKYRPHDWRALDCRICLAKDAKADPKQKLKAYQQICANFKPVFRHFFMETFKDPAVWFQRRLAYTRSVATNSIVGYILGLGDRHVQNILIDMTTAELIHIDLGIAFEMGHTLPTPETVPFRLTRDTVDGMGIIGVEGVFRRCCEKTMQVMRNNGELLLTIVQVLMYDPLSHWALTPQLMMAIQRKREQAVTDNLDSVMSSGTVPSSGQQMSGMAVEPKSMTDGKDKDSKMAERTLLRLKQKLNGVEDGAQLGLEGQVNCLIQQASDPKNLSCLYAGWQPYL